MLKGDATKQNILDKAISLASALGLDGLSIGRLADELKLSKSGLFAHFKSKEKLQIQVLDLAAYQFSQVVVKPTVQRPRGKARVQALFENWMKWGKGSLPGGCIFMAAAFELDDQPGPVRDHLVRLQKEWVEVIRKIAEHSIEAGYFKKNLDATQFAFDFYSIGLSYHYFSRLLEDKQAEKRARNSFESLLDRSTKTK
jgi:AcrR family transcriptional regulator